MLINKIQETITSYFKESTKTAFNIKIEIQKLFTEIVGKLSDFTHLWASSIKDKLSSSPTQSGYASLVADKNSSTNEVVYVSGGPFSYTYEDDYQNNEQLPPLESQEPFSP
ncbi:MAG: hypothetical protein Q8L98_03140 [Chlamydiales bacterium]|nr:hypothetical protein [Chlamydiales bacterium]